MQSTELLSEIKPGIPNLIYAGTGEPLTADEHARNANVWGLVINGDARWTNTARFGLPCTVNGLGR